MADDGTAMEPGTPSTSVLPFARTARPGDASGRWETSVQNFVVVLALVTNACNTLLLWRVVKLLENCAGRQS
jgi:hypothetical protein